MAITNKQILLIDKTYKEKLKINECLLLMNSFDSGYPWEINIQNQRIINKKISSFTVVEAAKNGKLENKITNGKLSLTYIPNPSFTGQDSFKFKVSDGVLESGISKVDITVNRQPVGLRFSSIGSISVGC